MKPANWNFQTPDWKQHEAKFLDLSDETPRELGWGGRNYQLRFYEAIKNELRTILIAPTGSGKSIMQIFGAAHEIITSDYRRKQIFLVPELLIGNEFTEQKHRKIKIDGKVYSWEVTANCVFNNKESVSRIKKFLLEPAHPCKSYRAKKALGGITAVVTYAAFLAAWKSMSKAERKKACENTSFRVDETHHVSGVSNKDSRELNRLGKFCQFVLDNNDPTCGLHLTTASFFRTKGFILSPKQINEFVVFSVPMLEHWEALGLKELQQNYEPYESAEDLMDTIVAAIAEEPNEPHLIYVPRDSTGIFKTADKNSWVKKLISKLEATHPGQVIDLVTRKNQKTNKDRFVETNQDFQIVVTCYIGREGADWKPLSRIHNTNLDKSVLMSYQKLGRLLRPYKNKTVVRITNYIKHFDSWDATPEVIREKLSDMFNAVILSAMMDDFWHPILMPVIEPNNPNKKGSVKSVTLDDLYGENKSNVIERLMRDVLSLPDVNATAVDEVINSIVADFKDYQLKKVAPEDIVNRLRKELVRRQNPDDQNLRIDGILVDFIRESGWDKVVKEKIAGHWCFHGKADTESLRKLNTNLNDLILNLDAVQKIGLANLDDMRNDPLYGWAARFKAENEAKKAKKRATG